MNTTVHNCALITNDSTVRIATYKGTDLNDLKTQ